MFNNNAKKIKELEDRIIELEMATMRFPGLYHDKRHTAFAEKIPTSKILKMLEEKEAAMPASERLKLLSLIYAPA